MSELDWRDSPIDDLRREVDRLRAELARRDEQIAAVCNLHVEDGFGHCLSCVLVWPCPTIRTLGGAS